MSHDRQQLEGVKDVFIGISLGVIAIFAFWSIGKLTRKLRERAEIKKLQKEYEQIRRAIESTGRIYSLLMARGETKAAGLLEDVRAALDKLLEETVKEMRALRIEVPAPKEIRPPRPRLRTS